MAIQDFTAGQILTAAQMDALQANDYNQTVSTKTDNYVLVAADKGTRVVMNAATAKTFTVNSGLFAAGDTLFLQNIGAGTATVTAGTCTVTTVSSLVLAQWAGGTLYFTSASAAIFLPNDSVTQYAIFNETQAAGTDGGTPVGSEVWTKRTLNTTVANSITGCSIASSVITLANPGTYVVECTSPFYSVNRAKARFRNTSYSTNAAIGTSIYLPPASNAYGASTVTGIFTTTATKNFELQYAVNTATASVGLGLAFTASGISEIWGVVQIVKVA